MLRHEAFDMDTVGRKRRGRQKLWWEEVLERDIREVGVQRKYAWDGSVERELVWLTPLKGEMNLGHLSCTVVVIVISSRRTLTSDSAHRQTHYPGSLMERLVTRHNM